MVVWEVVYCAVVLVVVVVIVLLWEILTSEMHMMSIFCWAKLVMAVWGFVRTLPEALMLR